MERVGPAYIVIRGTEDVTMYRMASYTHRLLHEKFLEMAMAWSG